MRRATFLCAKHDSTARSPLQSATLLALRRLESADIVLPRQWDISPNHLIEKWIV